LAEHGQNGLNRWAKPDALLADRDEPDAEEHQQRERDGRVESAVGAPPNGSPSCLNGKNPTWFRMK